MIKHPWTDEETALMLDHWYRGLPATAIAPLIGRTRGAVLGHIHRLGAQRKDMGREKPKVTKRVPAARVVAPVRYGSWSEENLTERWADRKERLRRERAQQTA